MRKFNTTGICIPEKHYMVDITDRVEQIADMVHEGEYFTINRARQYGKTTTLTALRKYLANTYTVISLDFQGISSAGFSEEETFIQEFCRLLLREIRNGTYAPDSIADQINDFYSRSENRIRFGQLFDCLSDWCMMSEGGLVLMVDEVDSATNNQVFLDFLAQLREGYINRDSKDFPAFQSVILAGVTDVKHLKSRIRDDDQHKTNSPLLTHAGETSSERFGRWNIAIDFTIDMSLSSDGIAGMLTEYETDHHTGMNIHEIARKIHDYTNGYPFLVSRLCQLIDTDVSKKLGDSSSAWTQVGVDEAVKSILAEKNTLFESLTGKLINYPELKTALHSILMEGIRLPYNPLQESINQMEMYGFIKNENNAVKISNRIFETLLYNLFLSDEELNNNIFTREGDLGKNIFIKNGRLDMPLILDHFIKTFTQVFGPLEERFKEKDGREYFLLYLKPIINGTGNYYIEAQTRDQTRTDVIVDYLGEQYVIELKIWRGLRYNEDGEQQLREYLDYFHLDVGYLLSFNFNKKKETGVRCVRVGDKVLYEAVL